MEGLNELLKMLSEKLGVGIDVVTQNYEAYLNEYARYVLVSEISFKAIPVFIGFALIVLVLLVSYSYYEDEYYLDSEKDKLNKYKKRIKIMSIASACVVLIVPISLEIIQYLSSPQMYAIHELLKQLK